MARTPANLQTTMPAFLGVPCVRVADGRPVTAMLMSRPFAFALADHYDDEGKCVAHGGWVRGPRNTWLVHDGPGFYALPAHELMTVERAQELQAGILDAAAAAAPLLP